MASWKWYNASVAIVELAKAEEKGKREVAATANIVKLVDKEHAKTSLKDLAKAPLSVFKGLSEAADTHFDLQGFTVRTVKDLAANKFPKIAQALVTLSVRRDATAFLPLFQFLTIRSLSPSDRNSRVKSRPPVVTLKRRS